ncbi:protein kinase [Chloroflexota bacterium]
MPLNPGDTLSSDHYRIQRQLGRGGFGFVYLAKDSLLNEDVAIKELIPALVGDEAMLKRFLAEARATMRLRHKRVVATHNVFSEGGNYYIVMEFMAGGSLEERLRGRGPLPVDEAVRVAAEVGEGLSCAHEEGVVHCDLKPHNILFDAAGSAKVADFGIAHVSGEMLTRSWMTPAGFVAGTLPYMSPEQAAGVRDDPRVDVYALGAVLYRMLTGRPYLDFDQRETPVAQADNVNRIRHEEPAPPSAQDPRIPQWLDGVVLRALAKRPEERFRTAAEMRAALSEPLMRLVGAGDVQPTPAARGPAVAAVPLALDLPSPSAVERPAPAASVPAPEAEAGEVQGAAVPASAGHSMTQPRRSGLPGWVVVAGAAAFLLVVVVAGWAILGGDGAATPEPTRRAVAAVTATWTMAPTVAPPSVVPSANATGLPSPTNQPSLADGSTRTQVPTTPSSTPTGTSTRELTPTPTDTLAPTSTPAPTATSMPTPTSELAGLKAPLPAPLAPGSRVVSGQTGADREIVRIDADGTQTILTENDAFDGHVAVSPDGTRIAFWSDRASGADVYVMHVDGTHVVRISKDGNSNDPSWLPDGNSLIYATSDSSGGKIKALDLLTAKTSTIVAFPYGVGVPELTADGKSIVFMRPPQSGPWWTGDLHVVPVEGGEATLLTEGVTVIAQDVFPWSSYFMTLTHYSDNPN